ELTDPASPAAGGGHAVPAVGARGEEDTVEAAVGDGAPARRREAHRARPGGERAGGAVPHDAGPQLGEVLARVAAGEHVEDGVEGGVAERLERGAAADQRGELVDGPVLDGEHGDDLLGEDVEGVGDDVQRLDRALLGPYRGDGRGEE